VQERGDTSILRDRLAERHSRQTTGGLDRRDGELPPHMDRIPLRGRKPHEPLRDEWEPIKRLR
jgi:hypothetical protein